MPVSTDHRQSKRCKHCEEANHGDSVYWNIQLDQDLLNTIISIYPEWFKGLKEGNENMAQGGGSTAGTSATSVGGASSQTVLYPRSPPKAEVDESPLQKSMDRNKESLKVKLMLRRPINQLVAQGIMPQLKTSPTIHEQRQKLERAKMGDLLKAKIQQRPDRQELVRQHILEADVGHVDPSLAERQRMLKKCRLVDSLNDQLSHRPGPLELIKKNILHTEEPIERAVKEGHIEFKATSEGQKIKPEHPDHYMTIDDDSQSSDAQSPRDSSSLFGSDMSPPSSQSVQAMVTDGGAVEQQQLFRRTGSDMLETAAAQAGIVTVVVAPNASLLTTAPSPLSLGSSTSSLSPLSSIASPSSVSCSNGATFACSSPAFTNVTRPALPVHQQQPAPGKDKNRKKSKSKAQQQKTRTIKFHEYKGPPSAQKNTNSSNSSNSNNNSASNSETSYELLLQQQQLFLQWQLEWQQKYPQMLLPVSQKTVDQNPSSPSVISLSSPSPSLSSQQAMDQSASPPPSTPPTPPPLPPPPPPPMPSCNNTTIAKPLRNLEDMKVSDLKAELKKRNLRVSGPKPHLIQRLKPYAESTTVTTTTPNSNNNHSNQSTVSSSNIAIPFSDDSIPDSSVPSPAAQINQPLSISSTEPEMASKPNSPLGHTNTNMVDSSANKVTSSGESNTVAEQSDEDIIREQQRKIEELQRQLLNSQLLLQQQRQQQQQLQQQARSSQTFQPPQAINAKANLAAFLQQQQLNQLLAQQQQTLQKQIQQQQQQIQQAVLNSNHFNNHKTNNKSNNVANNLNVVRNINNNIVISNANSNTTNTNGRERSNTVILGEHPATFVLNHVIKSEGHHQRTTSLPNFVGTFVQPHLVLSNQGMKQLVFDSDSVIIPEQIKIKNGLNGFINGSVVTTTANVDSKVSSSRPATVQVDIKPGIEAMNDSGSQIVLNNDNYVTLHIDEDDNMAVNEMERFNQNDEISKIFKQEYVNLENETVDDVLDLLMKNGEFDPPEPDTPSAINQFPNATQSSNSNATVAAPAVTSASSPTTSNPTNSTASESNSMFSTSNIDQSVPSQHLSLEELGIDMETFPMDLSEEPNEPPVQTSELMDVDTDWLDRLISSELNHSTPTSSSSASGNYESLLNNNIADPLDLFNIDDNDFKIAAEFSWDRVDFAT